MTKEKKQKIRPIAFYLPQFHPIAENDEWWGKGFTEWTNTASAKPLFKGHYQPHIPADLGFYDLRLPEARNAQAKLAKEYGIEAFCYWHYWFGDGKRLLERPFREVLSSGEPDFPFCLAWANQSWTGVWHGLKDKVLIEQKYPGKEDYKKHFYHILPAFKDKRYLRVDNKPLFVVYTPQFLPDSNAFIDLWQSLAQKEGLDGVYFVGIHHMNWDHQADGFDMKTIHQPFHYTQQLLMHSVKEKLVDYFKRRLKEEPFQVYNYKDVINYYDFSNFHDKYFIPTVLPNWDNSPRSKRRGLVFHKSKPAFFKQHLFDAFEFVSGRPETKGLLFIKSWNEWAEGNHLEPDLLYGLDYLKAVKEVVEHYS